MSESGNLFEDRPTRGPRPREFRLVLPYPLSTNALRAIFTPRKGPARLLDTEVARVYKDVARTLLQAAGGCLRWTGLLLVEVDFFRPTRTGDLANREKILSDALQTWVEELRDGAARTHPGLFEDDGQMVELRLRRYEDKDYPRAQVTVRVVPGPSGPPPERWAPPAGWAQALALLEAAKEKKRVKQRAKRAEKEPKAIRQALPAGSQPGTPSYGSIHFPGGLPPSRGRGELKELAKPASYPALRPGRGQTTLGTGASSAPRGKNDDRK